MTNQSFNNLYCSRNCKDFIILYDALGNYLLYYDNEFLADIQEPMNPKELHKNHHIDILVPFEKFKYSENKNPTLETIFNQITDILGDFEKNQRTIMSIFGDLIRSIKDAFIDPSENYKNFSNAPQYLIDIAKELSIRAGADVKAFDKLVTPKSIEDVIQQRANPILTSEEKAKADAIAKQINEIGLLPYLDKILDKIHIGEHRNIYRKILMEFKKMRGEASYIGETTAKKEAGKSLEDKIVYSTIIPNRYIFEVNQMTEASFIRYAIINPRYYDRMTLLFGDLGAKKSFKKVEPILNIVKPLITENKYKHIKSNTDNDTDIIEIPFNVDSIGAVYQTTKNSFTEDDDQLISRTLYSTPAKVNPKDIARQIYYQKNSKSTQTKNKDQAEQELKDFGLYLLQMVNNDKEILNPYFDVFWEYAEKSDAPIREFNQQLELFDAYCILTIDKCIPEPYGTLFASEEQLKEYMDFVNLENALIPYEYDFLDMVLAKGKSKELTILYNDFDLIDEDGNIADIDFDNITSLVECENGAIKQMNNQLKQKKKSKLRASGYSEKEIDDILDSYEPITAKTDLNTQQLKELPQKLLAMYGFRSQGAEKRIFFRYSDIKNYYGKLTAYKNIEDVSKLLQTLYNKGYLGKYELKQGKENLYYLTPMCNNLTNKFEMKQSYNRYVTDYFLETGYNNY